MVDTFSRSSDALRRVLFLCGDNYHESRFCEELFNGHARAEGLNWQASSRAVLPEPATRNDGPMSLQAIAALRRLGIAPVNHLRLPLSATDFDLRMSCLVVVLGRAWAPTVERLWPRYASQIDYWSLPAGEAHGTDALHHLRRQLPRFTASLQGYLYSPAPGDLATDSRHSA